MALSFEDALQNVLDLAYLQISDDGVLDENTEEEQESIRIVKNHFESLKSGKGLEVGQTI